MIKGSWIGYLILITILGLVVIYAPVFAVITIVFPPLFFLLMIMPSIFIYSWAITFFLILFRFMGKARYVIAPFIVVILSLAIPHYYNLKIDKRIQELTQEDFGIGEQLPNGGILAFEIPINYSIRGAQDNKCQSLCQRLLYNKAYEQVMVKAHRWNEAYNFYLENRATCPSYRQILDGVAVKIAKGECLIETRGSTDQADFIYKNEVVSYPDKKVKFKVNAITVRADRITVTDNRTSNKKVLYQKTKIEARPLMYPFLVGLGGGRELNFYAEIYRSKKILNESSEEDTKNIFGESAIKKIEESLRDKIKVINDFFDENLVKHNGIGARENQILESFWKDLAVKQNEITQEEINVMIRSLEQDRNTHSGHLLKIIRNMSEVPNNLIMVLGDKVSTKYAPNASRAIRALPEGKAKIIAPQLEKLVNDKGLRSRNWEAVTRLGDGSNLAIDQYINLLRDYREFLNQDGYDRDARKKAENEVSGAIIGLCRLGRKAPESKELLYSIFEMSDHWTKPSMHIAVALVQIVDMSELEQKYLNNDRIGKEIQRAIQKKERAINDGLNPC